MPPRSTYPLFDQQLDGKLDDILRDLVATESSLQKIAIALRERHGVTVDPVTIRRWLDQRGIDYPRREVAS